MTITIQAMATLSQGAELVPWACEVQDLGPQECLLKVQACGICHSDIHMIDNDWTQSVYPLVPGHEVIAEVAEVGSAVEGLKPGRRVGLGWQRSACLQCDDCMRGNENLCDRIEATIVGHHGGFADYVIADSRFCFPLPDGLATEVAGPLLCGGITVYVALRYAGMGSGKRIGVIGVGGLGHLAVRFAVVLGNVVTVFTSSPDKAEAVRQLGAREVILTQDSEWEHQPSKPFDILLSTVPAAIPLETYVNKLKADGTLSFVGVPDKDMKLPLFPLLVKRRRIMASPIGGRAMMREMLEVADTFGVTPLVETFPLSEVNAAIQKVRENKVHYRAVLLG